MELASRIAWRNEPEPLSFVLVTLKTRGVLGLFVPHDSLAKGASGTLGLRMPLSRVALSEVANMEARKTEPIDMNARVSAIRSANAWGEVFFFMVFYGVRCDDELSRCGYSTVA
jgi:hypothetical protein